MQRGAWIILRTNGKSTLRLASSLTEAGYEAWTPTQTRMVRAPRSKVQTEKRLPITPTFVFAQADRLESLIILSETRVKPQPDFSLFRYYGQYPLIADRALEPLRTEEIKTVPREKRELFADGAAVKIPDGVFAGMSGIVMWDDGQYVLVTFPGSRFPVKISAFHLRADNAYTLAVHSDAAVPTA